MLRQALLTLVLLVSVLSQTAAAQSADPAQSTRWIQIEAQPSLADAEDRARAWQGLFSDVVGFSTGSGWYVITLGPYDEPAAEARRAELRAENLIPRDSFVSDGTGYGPLFWPLGQTAPPALRPATATATADPAPAATADPAPAPAVIDETPDEARASESLLSQTDREDLQRALMWFGFYDSTVDGAFGRGTRASMAAWQDANGLDPTGVLTTAQRDTLLSAYRAEESAFGFQTVTESESGIEITLPLSLVAFDHYEPPFVHYTARDGSDTRILLLSQPGDEAALRGLYDTLQSLQIVPATGAREIAADSFTLRGESADRITVAFAATRRGMVKGWLASWNPQTAPQMDRVIATLQASFRPIGDRALDPGLVPLTPAVKSGLLSGLELRKPRLSATGFYVDAAGSVLTAAATVAQCGRITLDATTPAQVVATDPATGLAVLKPGVRLAPPAYARFAQGSPGTEIALSGYSYGDTLPAPVLTFGSLAAAEGLDGETGLNRLAVTARAGDAGGPVLTASGAVAGALLPRPETGRLLPKGVEFAAPPAVIAPLLAQAGITAEAAPPADPLTPQDQAALATQMTVLVSCWD